jgi:hypothetical protein
MTATPKTLNEAISNGLYSFGLSNRERPAPDVIEAHLRDFLAQKIGAAMLGTDSLETKKALQLLWEKITGENYADINRRSP